MGLIAFYGDSVVAGVGARHGRGCAADLARIVQTRTHQRTTCHNFGVSGMTTAMLLDALTAVPDYLASARVADDICVYIGGDDLIGDIPLLLSRDQAAMRAAVAESARHYTSILGTLHKWSRGPIVVGDLYNPFPASPLADTVISAYNNIVIYPAAKAQGVAVASVSAAFDGKQAQLIAGYRAGNLGQPGTHGILYPIHPNDAGHLVIAEVFASQLRA